LLKFDVRIGVPQGYDPDPAFAAVAEKQGARITLTRDPAAAVAGADVVVTDTWISMGQSHAEEKLAAMMPYQVTSALMAGARPQAKFLHCLPAHRGEEVVAEVIDGPQSLIWDEAENRIHGQKSVLLWALGKL
ncbi:MAG: ornithine carbamoyltransferase, partial [Sphingobium sp.]|nr:ornithine carbamoyltransferase [Sphingobium sp.]